MFIFAFLKKIVITYISKIIPLGSPRSTTPQICQPLEVGQQRMELSRACGVASADGAVDGDSSMGPVGVGGGLGAPCLRPMACEFSESSHSSQPPRVSIPPSFLHPMLLIEWVKCFEHGNL